MDNQELAKLSLEISASDASEDDIDRMTRQLLSELREMDVESAELVASEAAPGGTKSAGSVTAGAIAVEVFPGMLPKIMDMIQAWMMRDSGRSVKFKGMVAGQAIELEGSAEDLQKLLAALSVKGNTQVGDSSAPSQNQQPVMNHYENAVFVSYAWGGESERTVDELEQSFIKRGIRIVRDKKALGYKGSIETFEQRIGKGQCIVLVISDKYLRSEHCMYELVEINENRDFRERIFPIVLADAGIYKSFDRLNYIKYWDEQIEKLNQAIKGVNVMTNLTGFMADLDKYARIRASFDRLTDLLSDMNALTPEIHAANGFSDLISAVERTISKR
jgi:hypothetical protein